MESKKILIVDDDEICRKSVSNFAKKNNIEADAVGNGTEAVNKIKENPGKYNVIMIDMFMPDMNGYDTAKALKNIEGDKIGKLVIMSGDDLNEDEYKQHGFTKFLQKPVGKKAFEKLMGEI